MAHDFSRSSNRGSDAAAPEAQTADTERADWTRTMQSNAGVLTPNLVEAQRRQYCRFQSKQLLDGLRRYPEREQEWWLAEALDGVLSKYEEGLERTADAYRKIAEDYARMAPPPPVLVERKP